MNHGEWNIQQAAKKSKEFQDFADEEGVRRLVQSFVGKKPTRVKKNEEN